MILGPESDANFQRCIFQGFLLDAYVSSYLLCIKREVREITHQMLNIHLELKSIVSSVKLKSFLLRKALEYELL